MVHRCLIIAALFQSLIFLRPRHPSFFGLHVPSNLVWVPILFSISPEEVPKEFNVLTSGLGWMKCMVQMTCMLKRTELIIWDHLVTLAVILPNDKRTIRGWKLGGYKGNPKYLTRREPGETNQPQRSSLSAQRYQRQKFHSCSCWAEDQKTYTRSQAKHFAVCTIWKDWSSRLQRMNKPFAKWMWVIPSSWHLGWK